VKLKYVGLILLAISLVFIFGCHGKPKPVVIAPPPPPPVAVDTTTHTPPPPPPPPAPPLTLTTIYFDYDKYDLKADARDIMAQNAKSLSDHATATIRIEGNCDERGTDEYNLALGEKRANAAKDYLVNYGVNAARISTISYGETHPMDPGHSESAWAKNRRDEFKVQSE
jgi:peptidoglycan-associated lipoprotein